jgi:hypothetical protein
VHELLQAICPPAIRCRDVEELLASLLSTLFITEICVQEKRGRVFFPSEPSKVYTLWVLIKT